MINLLGAALIGGLGSSLISSFFGSQNVSETNAANRGNVNSTNRMNEAIAKETNALNYKMFQEMNDWNLARRDEEWAYNDPSAQMERMIKAGINPISALGGVDSGTAQQLTSSSPAAAVGATMQAARDMPYDFSHLAGLDDVIINAYDAMTRRNSQLSQEKVNKSTASFLDANAKKVEIENDWNLDTYDVRLKQESQKLENLVKSYEKMDAESNEAKALKLEIDERRKLYSAQIDSITKQLEQRDRELEILQQNADTARQNADTNSFNARTNSASLQFEKDKFEKQIKQWDNENIINWMSKFSKTVTGEAKGKIGGTGASISAGGSIRQTLPVEVYKMYSAGVEVLSRASADPNPSNLMDASQAAELMESMRRQLMTDFYNSQDLTVPNYFSQDRDVANPSDSWSQ